MPKNSGFLRELIASIVERGVGLAALSEDHPVEELCTELLSSKGEVSSRAIGSAILKAYRNYDSDAKLLFFSILSDQLDLDVEKLTSAANTYSQSRSAENFGTLTAAAEPPRQELLRRLNHVPGATTALVNMRSDLLDLIPEHPELRRIDLDFQHLFASWFNRGFLKVSPVSWETPANVLSRIIEYEAVHAIVDWDDLRRRLQPDDRRCFAFFHPAMPDEPLVFVEIALTRGIPSSIQEVLRDDRQELDSAEVDTAVFYSISNCQKGLRGISFGSFLIKQVVEDLSVELPKLKNFVTLSPIPGFSDWLESEQSPVSAEFLAMLKKARNAQIREKDGAIAAELMDHSELLRGLAARYLLGAKRSDGRPLDPVARFHLSNGASIHNLHAMADISETGLKNAFGVMVNYLYDMGRVETRHEAFAHLGELHTSRAISQLASARIPAELQR